MKTKLEMAHEYAIALINSDSEMQFDKFIRLCWDYADAMQAEADKLKKVEQSKHVFEAVEEWKPDWSKVPSGYDWFVVGGRSGKGFFCLVEPAIVKDHYWFVGEDCLSVDKHNYQGDWRESLRKRPE